MSDLPMVRCQWCGNLFDPVSLDDTCCSEDCELSFAGQAQDNDADELQAMYDEAAYWEGR